MIYLSGPTCPNNYFLNSGEADGKSCYGVESQSNEIGSSNALKTCQANNAYLRRPALPTNNELIYTIKPQAL